MMKRFTGVGLTLLLLALVPTILSSAPASAAVVAQGAVAIGGGDGEICASLVGGQARCWGFVAGGHLGDGTTQSSEVPVVVKGLSGATQFAAGSNSTCAIVANGAVRCWGIGGLTAGDGSTTPSAALSSVSGITGATSLAVTDDYACLGKSHRLA